LITSFLTSNLAAEWFPQAKEKKIRARKIRE